MIASGMSLDDVARGLVSMALSMLHHGFILLRSAAVIQIISSIYSSGRRATGLRVSTDLDLAFPLRYVIRAPCATQNLRRPTPVANPSCRLYALNLKSTPYFIFPLLLLIIVTQWQTTTRIPQSTKAEILRLMYSSATLHKIRPAMILAS